MTAYAGKKQLANLTSKIVGNCLVTKGYAIKDGVRKNINQKICVNKGRV